MSDVAQNGTPHRLKVAHVVTVYRAVVGILDAKLGALAAYPDLDVTAYSAPGPPGAALPQPKTPVRVVPMARSIRPGADLLSVWRLYRLFRRDRPDVVHTHSAKAGAIGAVAAWLAGVKLIVHTHHGLPFYQGQPRLEHVVFSTLEGLATKFRHHLLSQNRSDLVACARLIGSWEKVSFEGNGIDAGEVIARAEQGRADAEADFAAFSPDAFRLVMLARLEPVKRVPDFVAACALLARRGVNFGAVIAGVGPLHGALQRQIDSVGLSDRVKLLGWRENAPALLAAGDAAVLTSEKEGVPRSLMEAMALGKPIVATNVLGTQELVRHERTGWLTPCGAPAALADRLAELADDAPLRRWFGEAGRKRIAEHFDDRRIAGFLREFYYEQLGLPTPAVAPATTRIELFPSTAASQRRAA
ncbi:MAG TPA: glycosyltransferase family 4 protein [Pirellulales bacterium]